MSQQINLLNSALIKQKNFINTNMMAIMLGLLLVLMLGYYSYANKQLAILISHRSQVVQQLSVIQAQLKQATLLHTPPALNQALLDQITQLEQKEITQQQVLQTVIHSSATPDKGYAALMRAFAMQSLDGLWLTGFSIDSLTEQLNLSGRTLQGDLVPEYIIRLRNEPALKGKLFSALNMRLPKVEAPATNNQPAVASHPTLETMLKDGKTTVPVNQATNTSEAQINIPLYIEFSLQSTDDKSAHTIVSAKSVEKL